MAIIKSYRNFIKEQKTAKNPKKLKMNNFKKILFKVNSTKIGMKSKINSISRQWNQLTLLQVLARLRVLITLIFTAVGT